jgi:antitoxin VapB
MPNRHVAKLFRNGRSQAVRLPREFRFDGDIVRIRRTSEGVLLEPLIPDAAQWFAALDLINQSEGSRGSGRFMEKGRRQPRTPRRPVFPG